MGWRKTLASAGVFFVEAAVLIMREMILGLFRSCAVYLKEVLRCWKIASKGASLGNLSVMPLEASLNFSPRFRFTQNILVLFGFSKKAANGSSYIRFAPSRSMAAMSPLTAAGMGLCQRHYTSRPGSHPQNSRIYTAG